MRMGRPKALLPIDGTTFLGRILDNYRLLNPGTIALVLGADAPAVVRAISTDDLTVVINPRTGRGQLSSLLEGLAALQSCDLSGVIVHPVDHPMVGIDSLRLIIDAALRHPDNIVIPTFGIRRGHPVVFPSTLFAELAVAPPSAGARAVIQSHPAEILEVRSADDGILKNIDTPGEYERLCRDLQRTA